ncbi:MAG: oligosaccharide flippase family protein [Candidatus Contendobacter sp.]|nr:oligosaccharide flippase family protein [Candidatus Contendobacter sp.]
MLKRNLIANYLGQGWTALMGLAFVPLYIQYLGIEAYGLIGLFAVLQAWLSLLDMGMTPALNREMARFTGGAHSAQSIRDLLRSIEWIAGGIALLIALGIWAASGWLASDWLRAEKLPTEVVAQAFAIMGVVTALRFVEGVYRSAMVGLQRQVLFNGINASLATVRGLGAVALLVWVSPTIEAFFLWQGLVSIITLALLAGVTYYLLPTGDRGGRFSVQALRGIGHFAGGMVGITFLALLLTQVDKILLSKLLPLSEFGYYTLAAVVAGALYMLIGPITQAWYPRLCELHARADFAALADTYHKGAQLVTVIAGSAAVVVMLFSETLLHLWTQNADLAARTAPLVSLLTLGNLLNGLMWIPYQTQLAHGWTGLTVQINIVSVLVIVPAILWTTPRYGAIGAAWVWVSLNAGYVFIGIHFMYRRILSTEKWPWYSRDVLAPLVLGLVAASGIKWVVPNPTGNLEQLALLALAAITTLSVSAMAGGHTRQQLQQRLRPLFPACWRAS